MIYLDNAASTKPRDEVIKEMIPYLTENYGNPGSIHTEGRKVKFAIENAREQVASFINADPKQIIFTSGGSEANNLAIKGIAEYLRKNNKTHIITTQLEHTSTTKAIESLRKEFYTLFLSNNKDGRISVGELKEYLSAYNQTGLVSVIGMNNEIGSINPIESLSKVCRKNNTLFHTDCVQAAASIALDVKEIGCDFLTISSHKLMAPKGAGALYARNKEILAPVISGGGYQEYGIRGGTENVAAIVAFGKACELHKSFQPENFLRTISLRKLFENTMENALEALGIPREIITKNGEHINRILSLSIKGIDAQTLVLMADARGVCISAGSACNGLESKPSKTLKSIGFSDEKAFNTVRISFSESNTESEVKRAAFIIASCIRDLKNNNAKQ